MAKESFISAVEKALRSGQLTPREAEIAKQQAQLSPNERKIKRGSNLKKIGNAPPASPPSKTGMTVKAPNSSIVPVRGAEQPSMRRAKGRVVPNNVPRLTGEAAKKAPKGALLGRLAVPLAAAEQAYQTGKLILSEDARDEAAQDYADSADEGALLRTVKGGLGGVTTIYGAGRALADMDATNTRARKSMAELAKKEADPKNQRLVQSAQERQTIYMSLPKEEQSKIDKMGGKERQQYFQDMKNPKPAPASYEPAPASSEPAPPSSPATAGAQRSPMERQMTAIDAQVAAAPKAIPVAEPVDEDRAMALFQNTHGGPFDPKSSMDRGKMASIQNLMAQKGSENLTPNQFSLKIYRMSK